MNSLSSLRLAKVAVLVAFAASPLLVAAADPGAKKPEQRVPPTGAQMGDIPAGVDTGSPATSNSLQLGMPVPPSPQSGDQAEQNRRSAAARAAARPGPAASNANAKPIGPVNTTVLKKPADATAAKPASAPPR